ncbi:MAG: hypothetical protein IPJ98_16360 [Bryobacterales bacterium]|nr:hypothetical protein [Bryobacterales bacterium]
MKWPTVKLIPPGKRGKLSQEVQRPRFLLVLAVLLLVGDWLGNNIVFEPPAKWLGDILLRTRDKVVGRFTRIVRIDAEDHETILGGQTPVNGPALIYAVCSLAASKPR